MYLGIYTASNHRWVHNVTLFHFVVSNPNILSTRSRNSSPFLISSCSASGLLSSRAEFLMSSSTVFLIKEHTLECQHIREYARATARAQEDVLYLAIKQYIPLDNPQPQDGDVTIIGAHANGFPKVPQPKTPQGLDLKLIGTV
jgi:hypothetical protein